MILEKKISNYVSIGIAFYFLISLSCCSCKVHKSIQKEVSKYDSSVFANNEQKHISNSEEISNIKKKNDYSKITIELPEGGVISDLTGTENTFPTIKNNDSFKPKPKKYSFPKGTKITYETGTQKEISNTNKKVQIDSSQKENSKVEIKKKETHIDKTVDKKVPMWEVYSFCAFLIIGGAIWYFRKPIFSHIKGWITGV